jgi:hypothetical protein
LRFVIFKFLHWSCVVYVLQGFNAYLIVEMRVWGPWGNFVLARW